MKVPPFVATALVALALSAHAIFAQTQPTDGAEAASLASPKYGTWGFDAAGMDLSVKPGDDFFRYANGKWADRTDIPADRTSYGYFDKLAELSENRLHAILDDVGCLILSLPLETVDGLRQAYFPCSHCGLPVP